MNRPFHEGVNYIKILNELVDGLFTMATAQTTNFEAASGYLYPLGTTGLTITLPAEPEVGWRIRFFGKTSSIVSATLARNGQKINSLAANFTMETNEAVNLEIEFVGGSMGWRTFNTSNKLSVTVVSGDFGAEAGQTYIVDISSVSATLPDIGRPGDRIKIIASTEARSSLTINNAGNRINGVLGSKQIDGYQWVLELIYLNDTIGWLVVSRGVEELHARWDASKAEFRYYDGQRELSMNVGWAPLATGLHKALSDYDGTTVGGFMAANGTTVLSPIWVPSHMLLHEISIREGSNANLREAEWRLYRQELNNGNAGESVLKEVPGANGTFSFTPTVASNRTSAASGAPVYLAPGLYWLALRNTSTTQTFVICITNTSSGLGPTWYKYQTITSPLGSTFDAMQGTWTYAPSASYTLCTRLVGRVFGQTTGF